MFQILLQFLFKSPAQSVKCKTASHKLVHEKIQIMIQIATTFVLFNFSKSKLSLIFLVKSGYGKNFIWVEQGSVSP